MVYKSLTLSASSGSFELNRKQIEFYGERIETRLLSQEYRDFWRQFEKTSDDLSVIWRDIIKNNYHYLESLIPLLTEGASILLRQWLADEYKKSKESE